MNWSGFLLTEGLFLVAGFAAFYIWQMRTLKRDTAAREERERAEQVHDFND